MPTDFTRDLSKRVKNVHFTSNPSRLKFYTQEIVIFRENLIKKMQRHCVIPPSHGTRLPFFSAYCPNDCRSIYQRTRWT